jgi:hypothetical protein
MGSHKTGSRLDIKDPKTLLVEIDRAIEYVEFCYFVESCFESPYETVFLAMQFWKYGTTKIFDTSSM